MSGAKPPKKKGGDAMAETETGKAGRRIRTKAERKLRELSEQALDCLSTIMNDSSAKASDRLAAVKLALELSERGREKQPEGNTLKVVFEGAPTEWSE